MNIKETLNIKKKFNIITNNIITNNKLSIIIFFISLIFVIVAHNQSNVLFEFKFNFLIYMFAIPLVISFIFIQFVFLICIINYNDKLFSAILLGSINIILSFIIITNFNICYKIGIANKDGKEIQNTYTKNELVKELNTLGNSDDYCKINVKNIHLIIYQSKSINVDGFLYTCVYPNNSTVNITNKKLGITIHNPTSN